MTYNVARLAATMIAGLPELANMVGDFLKVKGVTCTAVELSSNATCLGLRVLVEHFLTGANAAQDRQRFALNPLKAPPHSR